MIMAVRGKVSMCMIFLVMTFGLLGLISFQALKERKNSTILLATKLKEIDDLNNQYEELLEATKKSLLQAKEEKDNLIHKIKDLENSEKVHYAMYKEDKDKYKIKKDQEIVTLREKLQAKDTELEKMKAKIELLKLENKRINGGMVIQTVVKDDLLEDGHESSIKTLDNKELNSKIPRLQNAVDEEKINDIGSVIEESNIASEAKVEDAKIEANFEANKMNRVTLEENVITASRIVGEEDDAKEPEVDMKVSDFDVRESNESQIQE